MGAEGDSHNQLVAEPLRTYLCMVKRGSITCAVLLYLNVNVHIRWTVRLCVVVNYREFFLMCLRNLIL